MYRYMHGEWVEACRHTHAAVKSLHAYRTCGQEPATYIRRNMHRQGAQICTKRTRGLSESAPTHSKLQHMLISKPRHKSQAKWTADIKERVRKDNTTVAAGLLDSWGLLTAAGLLSSRPLLISDSMPLRGPLVLNRVMPLASNSLVLFAAASRSASLREDAEPPPGVRLLALSRCRKPSPLPPYSCKG